MFDLGNVNDGNEIDTFGNDFKRFGPKRNAPVMTRPMPNPMSVANNASLVIRVDVPVYLKHEAGKIGMLFSIGEFGINCKPLNSYGY